MPDDRREIPASEWIAFLDDFTREHRGLQVRIEVQSSGERPQVEAHDVPLQGISADDRGSEKDVNIMVGDARQPGLTHMVPSPRRLRIERAAAGDTAVLVVESADGSTTTVRVRAARRAA